MRIIRRLIQELKNGLYRFESSKAQIQPRVDFDVPFVCQFARPESAEPSLRKEIETVNDPAWQETGALSKERYAQWAFTMCGMASAAMALRHLNNVDVLPAELAEDAMLSGVYVDEEGIISGMKYREFATWIRKYGIKVNIYSKLNIKGIQYALSDGKLVIVSVNPNIRGYETAPLNQKGGHLVLVTGYDLNEKTIMINNPSGFISSKTQTKHELSYDEFDKYYAGRGLVLSVSK